MNNYSTPPQCRQWVNDDGGKGRARSVEFLHGCKDTCQMIRCINHSARGGEKTLYSPFFCMMTSICCLHLPSLLTQAGPKRKPRFQVLVFVHQQYSILPKRGRRWKRLSVYCRLFHLDGLRQRSRHGSSYSEHISAWLWRSSMLSPLCWQIHTAMRREREKVWRPIYRRGRYHQGVFSLILKNGDPLPLLPYQGCTFEQPLVILHKQQWEQMVREMSIPL